MMYRVYSLLDLKTGHYSRPFFALHQADAIRDVIALAESGGNHVSRHPADFQLTNLGEFDDQSGLFSPAMPTVIGTVQSFAQAAAKPVMPLFDQGTYQKLQETWANGQEA